MKLFVIVTCTLLLSTSAVSFAADTTKAPPPETCIVEKIEVQKLRQENAALLKQLMQVQFSNAEQGQKAAKAEEKRLQSLLSKPTEKGEK